MLGWVPGDHYLILLKTKTVKLYLVIKSVKLLLVLSIFFLTPVTANKMEFFRTYSSSTTYIHPSLDSRTEPKFSDCIYNSSCS